MEAIDLSGRHIGRTVEVDLEGRKLSGVLKALHHRSEYFTNLDPVKNEMFVVLHDAVVVDIGPITGIKLHTFNHVAILEEN